MGPIRVASGIEWVGAADFDRKVFDDLVPLTEGTSYNAWLLRGERATVLFDTVDPSMEHIFRRRLSGVDRVDVVVSHHAEQDHSGCLPFALERWPEARVLTSKRGRDLLVDELHLDPGRVGVVEDGETLDIGGRSIRFLMMPWVHWPETFVSFVPEDGTLLTCDMFGSHLATGALLAGDGRRALPGAKRYFAEIMAPFRPQIERHLDRLAGLEIARILPSHGPAWDRPEIILDAWREWTSAPPANLAAVLYVSMHGSTRMLVEHLVGALMDRGVDVRQFNLTGVDQGDLAVALLDASTIVFASPTVMAGLHPNVASAAFLVNALKPKARGFAFIGSHGWGPGKSEEQLHAILSGLKVEWLPAVQVRSRPREADLAAVDRLADAISERHAAPVLT